MASVIVTSFEKKGPPKKYFPVYVGKKPAPEAVGLLLNIPYNPIDDDACCACLDLEPTQYLQVVAFLFLQEERKPQPLMVV